MGEPPRDAEVKAPIVHRRGARSDGRRVPVRADLAVGGGPVERVLARSTFRGGRCFSQHARSNSAAANDTRRSRPCGAGVTMDVVEQLVAAARSSTSRGVHVMVSVGRSARAQDRIGLERLRISRAREWTRVSEAGQPRTCTCAPDAVLRLGGPGWATTLPPAPTTNNTISNRATEGLPIAEPHRAGAP